MSQPDQISMTARALGIRRVVLTPTQFAIQFAEDSVVKPSQVWEAFQILMREQASKHGVK